MPLHSGTARSTHSTQSSHPHILLVRLYSLALPPQVSPTRGALSTQGLRTRSSIVQHSRIQLEFSWKMLKTNGFPNRNRSRTRVRKWDQDNQTQHWVQVEFAILLLSHRVEVEIVELDPKPDFAFVSVSLGAKHLNGKLHG